MFSSAALNSTSEVGDYLQSWNGNSSECSLPPKGVLANLLELSALFLITLLPSSSLLSSMTRPQCLFVFSSSSQLSPIDDPATMSNCGMTPAWTLGLNEASEAKTCEPHNNRQKKHSPKCGFSNCGLTQWEAWRLHLFDGSWKTDHYFGVKYKYKHNFGIVFGGRNYSGMKCVQWNVVGIWSLTAVKILTLLNHCTIV